MRFRRQGTQSEVSVNLTPLIDVVFLLLIFFMVSTTFTRETHLAVNLPESSGIVLEKEVKQIEVIISKAGAFAVNGRNLVNANIETLKSALSQASKGDVKLPVMITADAKAAYQSVVVAMDAAGQLGFVNLIMTTKKVSEIK
ncbi:MAG: biopolymer transporter ExbD [Candidatus Endonucleobacter bathymodioli]|uniref:Biopolymer transporter ExbD n=1 Tax=Candidatus Endonucleibacter bathymodioli TaxID=539814 RepID=A0AA90NJC6_9GAMM|nr:biopolymer transporter ExbD [Candidatus Endonucleobacter bathymodioli]